MSIYLEKKKKLHDTAHVHWVRWCVLWCQSTTLTAGKSIRHSNTLPSAKRSHMAFHAPSKTYHESFFWLSASFGVQSYSLIKCSVFPFPPPSSESEWLQKQCDSPQPASVCRTSSSTADIVHSGPFILGRKRYTLDVPVLCLCHQSPRGWIRLWSWAVTSNKYNALFSGMRSVLWLGQRHVYSGCYHSSIQTWQICLNSKQMKGFEWFNICQHVRDLRTEFMDY